MNKIIFSTKRFSLREWTESDAAFLLDLNSDPEVTRYTGDPAFESLESARQFIREYDAYQKTGIGRWLIESHDTLFGWCGLKINEDGEVDLGFRLMKRYWGQGIATETALGSLKYGFEVLGKEVIVGRAMPENLASIQVLKKVGMERVGEVICDKHPAVKYSMSRKLWQKIHLGL